MTQPNIKGLAVHRIKVTSELLEEGMEVKHSGQRLSASEWERVKGQLI